MICEYCQYVLGHRDLESISWQAFKRCPRCGCIHPMNIDVASFRQWKDGMEHFKSNSPDEYEVWLKGDLQ